MIKTLKSQLPSLYKDSGTAVISGSIVYFKIVLLVFVINFQYSCEWWNLIYLSHNHYWEVKTETSISQAHPLSKIPYKDREHAYSVKQTVISTWGYKNEVQLAHCQEEQVVYV